MEDNNIISFPSVSEGAIGGSLVQTVNARDLHAFLGVGKVFAAWIGERIHQYGFEENRDFVVFSESGNNPLGGRPAKEYAITIDMAKELAMVERNERGKRARQYFLECERIAKEKSDPLRMLNDPAAMRGLLLNYAEKVITLEGRVAEMQPSVEALERIAVADGSLCITDAAKTLQIRPKDLFQYLRSHGWIYRRPGTDTDIAYQSKLVSGVLEHKTTTVYRSDGSEKVTTQVRVTPKGLTVLAKVFPPAASAA